MKKVISLLLALALALALAACGGQGVPAADPDPAPPAPSVPVQPEPEEPPEPADTRTPAERQADEWLAAMSREEKTAQLLVAGIEGTQAGEDGLWTVGELKAGGVILFGRNVESAGQLTALVNELKAASQSPVPLLVTMDEEGGRVSRMPPEVEKLPDMWEYGRTGDADLCARLGQTLAARCAAFGIGMDFAPVLDVWTNPENTVIGPRAFSDDCEEAARLGTAAMTGMQSGGVIPVVKHFPGHGDTAVDSHLGLPVVDKSLAELEGEELVPFAAAIRAGADAVMVAHIQMNALDGARPASLSPAVVNGLLREDMGFSGVVCTDDLTMGAIMETYTVGEAAVLAVEAGCDLLLVCHGQENVRAAADALNEAVDSGRISEERLNESVRRILLLKAKYGLSNAAAEAADVDALNELTRSVLPGD